MKDEKVRGKVREERREGKEGEGGKVRKEKGGKARGR